LRDHHHATLTEDDGIAAVAIQLSQTLSTRAKGWFGFAVVGFPQHENFFPF
jgi:hypothetical protein